MKINRLICMIAIIGSGIFASFYGGNIPYALFYLSIFVPIISFLYTVYVYVRFKLYQTVDSRVLVKGDWTVYSFVIANEDMITFRNIKVNFLKDKSTIEQANNIRDDFSLLPNESERLQTRLRCNYRGEYYVGVESVEVKDFLYLFKITYPNRSMLKAVVLPRIVQIDQLAIAPPQVDVKNPIHRNNISKDELDMELRKYNMGDNKKQIHWKASAKQRELLSRKFQSIPKAEIALFMDLTKLEEDELTVISAEDKIIESVLAIANYYSSRHTSSHIIYDMNGLKQININTKEEFSAFYQACVSLRFTAKTPIYDLMKERMFHDSEGIFYIAVTPFLTKEFYLTALQVIAKGNSLSVLYISDDMTKNTKALIDSLRISGVSVHQVMSEDEISDVLNNQVY